MQSLFPQDAKRRVPRLRSRHLAGVAGLAVVGAAAFALPAFAGNSPAPSSDVAADGDLGECIVATDADGEALLRHIGADPSKVAKPLPEGAEVIDGGIIADPAPTTLPPGVTPAKPLPKGATVTYGWAKADPAPVTLPPGVTPAKPLPKGAKVTFVEAIEASSPGVLPPGAEPAMPAPKGAAVTIAVPAGAEGATVSGEVPDVSDLPGCAELYGGK